MKFAKFLRAPILMNICKWPTASLIWNMAYKFSITSFSSILHNSTADSEVSINITTMSLVLNVLRFFVFYLLWRHHWSKNVVLCNNWYCVCSEILSYSCATHIHWMEIHLKTQDTLQTFSFSDVWKKNSKPFKRKMYPLLKVIC